MLFLSLTLVVLFHCSMYWLSARVIWMVGTRRTRQKLRRRRGLFVTLLLVVLSCQLVFPPAMSREDSFAAAIRRSLGSNPDVLSSVRRQTSHDVHYVQAFNRRSININQQAQAPRLRRDLSPTNHCGMLLFFKPASDLEASCVQIRSSSVYFHFPHTIKKRSYSSVSLPSVCFSFLIGLLSCVAVSTGPEDAIEITSFFLVDEVWTSTSLYVTIIQLSDFVVKATSTH
ncbi:unnamed protein product [Brassica oleracea]